MTDLLSTATASALVLLSWRAAHDLIAPAVWGAVCALVVIALSALRAQSRERKRNAGNGEETGS